MLEILEALDVLDSLGKLDVAGAGSAEPEMDLTREAPAERADGARRVGGGDGDEAQGQGFSVRVLDGAQEILDGKFRAGF